MSCAIVPYRKKGIFITAEVVIPLVVPLLGILPIYLFAISIRPKKTTTYYYNATSDSNNKELYF